MNRLYGYIKGIVWRLLMKWPLYRNKYQESLIKHHTYDARELFFQENSDSGFNRYDMIVRLLAIENYFEKNTFGLDLYRKMQTERMGKDWTEPAVERFKHLIQSYEKNGYNSSSEITLTKDLKLEDGSHRMALAFYFKQYQISCRILPYKKTISYGLENFVEYGFSKEEITTIKQRFIQLYDDIRTPFICTLWSPAQDFFEEITDKISLLTEVLCIKDFEFDKEIYESVVKAVYAVDDIESWKIEKKIEHMNQYQKRKIRVLYLDLPQPSFRIKDLNSNTLSTTCEKIKKAIRNCYKNRIKDYFYDVILHIGDNFYQNTYIKFLFEKIEETNNLGQFSSVPEFLFQNVLDSLNNKDFDSNLAELKIVLKKNNLDLDKVCVVGSSVLSLLGIRENHDIDIVLTSDLRQPYGKGVAAISDNIEIVSANWARSKMREIISDDELIMDSRYHFIYKGVKFCKPYLLFERKVWQGRNKDVADVYSLMNLAYNENHSVHTC